MEVTLLRKSVGLFGEDNITRATPSDTNCRLGGALYLQIEVNESFFFGDCHIKNEEERIEFLTNRLMNEIKRKLR